jgi:hypothetical protein
VEGGLMVGWLFVGVDGGLFVGVEGGLQLLYKKKKDRKKLEWMWASKERGLSD